VQREPKGLLQAVYRPAHLIGSHDEASSLVTAGAASYVEIPYLPKGIFRASANLPIAAGGHGLIGSFTFSKTNALVCLHVPLRSRDILESKVEQSRRLDAAGLPPEHGWQQRHFAKQADAGKLDAEWAANSADDSRTLAALRGPVNLLADWTLARLLAPHIK
jgi:hypothetical protein